MGCKTVCRGIKVLYGMALRLLAVLHEDSSISTGNVIIQPLLFMFTIKVRVSTAVFSYGCCHSDSNPTSALI